jgi:H+/Cl- antiporter ClcA
VTDIVPPSSRARLRWRWLGAKGKRRESILALGRHSRQVLLLSAVTGVVTGAAVAGFDQLTGRVLVDRIFTGPLWLQAVGPLLGLLAGVLALRHLARGASPSTADEYIKNFHQRGQRLATQPVPGRVLASVTALGLGGPLGYEGPSVYLGAAVGSRLQARFSISFRRRTPRHCWSPVRQRVSQPSSKHRQPAPFSA